MSELPSGWLLTQLGTYIEVKNGYAFKSSDYISQNENSVAVLRISDIQNGAVTTQSASHVPSKLAMENFRVHRGDLLIAMSGATTGKTGVYSDDTEAYQNQRVGNIKLLSEQLGCRGYRDFLVRYLTNDILKKAYGAAQPNISAKAIEELIVPIAPLNEQVRIADKLDSILGKVNKAQARLDKIPAILKRFRQSVLAAATSGELTKEWRNNQDYNQVIINNLDDENDPYNVWNKSKNKKIPEGWLYCKLYQLGKIQGGGTPSKSKDEYWGGEIPWVTPKDMKIDFIANSKLTVTSKGVDESSAKLIKDGSVMFVVRGMILAHSFPVAINEKMVTVNQDMKCITPSDFVDSKYLLFSLKSLKDLFVELASSSTHGTKRLESKMYRNVAISIPSMSEQIEIVKQVESLFMMADTLEKKYLEAKSRLDRLTQSILAKAFRGELASQSDKDESAEVLLNRIKAESPKVKSNK